MLFAHIWFTILLSEQALEKISAEAFVFPSLWTSIVSGLNFIRQILVLFDRVVIQSFLQFVSFGGQLVYLNFQFGAFGAKLLQPFIFLFQLYRQFVRFHV